MSQIKLIEFIEKLATVFDETNPATIDADTKFKELDEWDSMKALSLIAMADDEFNLKVRGDDIRNSVTVRDLFEKINR